MFSQLDKELRFGYQLNGSLVLAFNQKEFEHLSELKKRGETNGVKRLQIFNREEVLKREPHVNDKVVGALYSPDAGNVIPYEYTIALAENAVAALAVDHGDVGGLAFLRGVARFNPARLPLPVVHPLKIGAAPRHLVRWLAPLPPLFLGRRARGCDVRWARRGRGRVDGRVVGAPRRSAAKPLR